MSQSDSSHSFVPGGNTNTVDFPDDNPGNDAQSSDDIFVAQDEQVTTIEDNIVFQGVFLALLVYVDDIIITGNNIYGIDKFIVFLKSKFMIKDLEKLKYFLGIEVIDIDIEVNGKIDLLDYTRPDISYVVHCLSQFMHSSLKSHRKIAFKILRYLKGCPGLDNLTKGLETLQDRVMVEKLGMFDIYQVETKGDVKIVVSNLDCCIVGGEFLPIADSL
nr:ribonuclease H-like domain-containing protein [Tanacetum cinerariifolium]